MLTICIYSVIIDIEGDNIKTEQTVELEKLLFKYTSQLNQFGVHECTLGFGKGGRVDYITIDTKDTIRCYEIKISVSDFHSKHGHNFKGNLNYYVMPNELYEKMKDGIPKSIGVICPYGTSDLISVKKAKRKDIDNLHKIKDYIIRSLFREYEAHLNSEDVKKLKSIIRSKNYFENKYNDTRQKLNKWESSLYLKFGRDKLRELKEEFDI